MNAIVATSGTLNYSFGAVTITINADGSIDRPTEMVDHMLSTASAVAGVEIVNNGIPAEGQNEDASTHEKYTTLVKFGDLTLGIEIAFDLAVRTSKRALNSMVFGGILPRVVQTAGIYVGDYRAQTSPPSPLPARPRRVVLDNIDRALILMTEEAEAQLTSTGNPSNTHQIDDQNTSR